MGVRGRIEKENLQWDYCIGFIQKYIIDITYVKQDSEVSLSGSVSLVSLDMHVEKSFSKSEYLLMYSFYIFT